MCVRALRRWFICETVGCINGLLSTNPSGLRGRVVSFLAIPTEEHRFGHRTLPDLQQLNKTLQKRFERDKFPLAFAGVDVSPTCSTTPSRAPVGSRICMASWSG
jgi:hypothetical protein